jgi:hypothetical protein
MHQEIIDVHLHCLAGPQHAAAVLQGIEMLRGEGLRHLVVMGLVNTHLDEAGAGKLMPAFAENRGSLLCNEAQTLLEFARLAAPTLLPLVDTRHMQIENVAATLQGYIEQGFRGIKGIYLADSENDVGVSGVPETLGISLAQYQRREWEIFAFAEANDLPLLYHMDARRYGDLMGALLEDFPRLRVNFAHLGIGRSAFRKILDRHANVFTDLSALRPHVQSNPESYRDFITHYPDRVCFGSDALLYQPEVVLDYIRMVRDLRLPEEIESRVFSENPRKFLGRILGEASQVPAETPPLSINERFPDE